MAQNIYDDRAFFEGYSKLARSVRGLEGAAEWPAVRAMLPPLAGKRVVDLGCGFGWFARWAKADGAAYVLGVDLSENMIAHAKSKTDDPDIEYAQADLDQLDLPPASYDLAYSSLVFHYLSDFGRLVRTVYQALVPGSNFVFTLEHPIYMAPAHPAWGADRKGQRAWPVNQYAVEGPRTTDWLVKGVVKQHRTIGTTLNTLIASGFQISHVEEWYPSDGQIAANPQLAEERDRPMFLLIGARR